MHHGYNRPIELEFIPLVSFHARFVLHVDERSHVPRDVVTPSDRLDPMHTAGVHPDQVARFLQESINGYVRLGQIGRTRPPRTRQVRQATRFAHLLDAPPVTLVHAEPFAVARTDVHVERAQAVVLLVAGRATTGHFQVHLHRVHAVDLVAHVSEHVARRDDSHERRQFGQLLQLFAPFLLVRKVDVRAESNRLEFVLLRANAVCQREFLITDCFLKVVRLIFGVL